MIRKRHPYALTDESRSTLHHSEKKAYIGAVQCLAKLPPKTPAGVAAGAKNRYDDLVATHINQTLSIHGTGFVLPPIVFFEST